MQVDYMVLADAAETANNKHFILGGGFDTLFATQLPVTHPRIAVALKILVPWQATSQEHSLELDLIDEDARSILPQPFLAKFEVGRPPGMRAGDSQSLPLVLNFTNVMLQSTGAHKAVCRLDGSPEEWSQSFRVVQISAPQQRVD